MICAACQAENDDKNEVCISCGQALTGGVALTRGSVVASRYEILAPLGKGGMGMVFKARDRVLDETVALKILRADVARAPEMERRFRSEIKLARRVRHRNVCGIHEYGEDGRLRYIAMELVEGTDLKHFLLEKGALPVPQAFEVAIQLAQGLEAIHEAGVVHRDLKTSNVMLDRLGRVRLMDFGIAKQLGSDVTLGGTGLGKIIGTPEYMSPEQARGEKLDVRSDLYALGIVTYEIFTGRVPFRGDTPIATIFKTLEQPPDLEGPAAAAIPRALVPVLGKALAKDPAQRYGSAREMLEAIKWAGRERPGAASPPAAEPGTISLASVTEVSRPAPTPVPMPTPLPQLGPPPGPAPDASGPTAILESRAEDVEPTFILRAQAAEPTRVLGRAQPPPHRSRPGPPGALRQPPSQRNVWPWLLAGGLLFVIAGAAMVLAFHSLLRARASPPGVGSRSRSAARATPTPELLWPGRSSQPTVRPTSPPTAPPTPEAVVAPPTESPAPRQRRPPTSRRVADSRTPSPGVAVLTATPAPAASSAAQPQTGLLQLRVTPWAAVSVDDAYVGTTPLRPLVLSAGSHTVQLTHPDYRVLRRKVTIRTSETTRLEIDLAWEAVPKQP